MAILHIIHPAAARSYTKWTYPIPTVKGEGTTEFQSSVSGNSTKILALVCKTNSQIFVSDPSARWWCHPWHHKSLQRWCCQFDIDTFLITVWIWMTNVGWGFHQPKYSSSCCPGVIQRQWYALAARWGVSLSSFVAIWYRAVVINFAHYSSCYHCSLSLVCHALKVNMMVKM